MHYSAHCLMASVAYVTTLTYASTNKQWACGLVSYTRLHDRANTEQTSSKCIHNARANCATSA